MVHFAVRTNRFHFRWLLVALCLCGFALRSYAQSATLPTPDPLTIEERAWLVAHPELRLSPDPAYQPVEFFDEQGIYRGISAEYIALIEQRLGFRFQIVDRSKEQAAFAAGGFRIDTMPTCAPTPNRQKNWLFTTPYLEFPTYLITRKSVGNDLTLEQLSGSRVAVVGNYAAREYLATNYPNLVLDPVPDARTGLQKVSFGLVDAFVSELPVATYWMEHEGITNLKVAGTAGYVYQLGFGMPNDLAPLHGILEKGLAQIRPEERAAIYQKWVKLPAEPTVFLQRMLWSLIGGLSLAGLGLLGVFWWNRTLAAQVKQQTAELQQELTERKLIEAELRGSEERFATMFRSSPSPMGISRSSDGEILDVNDRWVQLSGYTKEELVGLPAVQTNLWRNSSRREQLIQLLRTQQRVRDFEATYYTKSGEPRMSILSVEQINLGAEQCNLWTIHDITDRKRAEEQIKISEQQLRKLAGYLQTIREEERTAMAREIHDELGQSLTAMKMDLAWLAKRLPENQSPLQERAQGMTEMVNDTIKMVRRLVTQLRPAILDDLGLEAALEWQAQEFQTRTGITCNFITKAKVADLVPERATAIFRICQESLTNVARHAHATNVSIRLWEEQNYLLLEVKDNGRGITNETAQTRSFGLLGMRERAFLLGGEFQLTSSPDHGTTVLARIPRYQSLAKGGGA